MTLYRDPTVKWGGMEVGGIRISHMSDIESAITLALTMTRANKKPFTVRPIEIDEAHERLLASAREVAETGTEAYSNWWRSQTKEARNAIGETQHGRLKEIAAAVRTGI